MWWGIYLLCHLWSTLWLPYASAVLSRGLLLHVGSTHWTLLLVVSCQLPSTCISDGLGEASNQKVVVKMDLRSLLVMETVVRGSAAEKCLSSAAEGLQFAK